MPKRMTMSALALVLAATASPNVIIRAEAQSRLDECRDRLVEINDQMNAIQATADAEKRPLTKDESDKIDELFAEFEGIEAEIERRTKLEAASQRLATPQGRQTDPNFDPQAAADPDRPADPAPGAARRPVRASVPAQPRDVADAGRWGFRSFGEFAQVVHRAGARGGGIQDARLNAIRNAAPSEYGREGVGEDGGFAVPPDFRTTIMKKVMGEESLLARTDQQSSSSNTMTVPKDETTPWQTTGGLQAYWAGEGAQYTPKKPQLEDATIRLHKLTALVPVTEELLEDAPSLSGYLNSKVPDKMNFKVTDAIVNGTGAGMPMGILTAPSLVTVAKESGQAADTVLFQNIVNMWSRCYGPWRSNGVWLVNQDVEPQLQQLAFPNAGSGTVVPVYLPPGGLSQSPFATLYGRPVIPTEACPTLGDLGDIILTDLRQYLTVARVGGIRQQVSIHLWFDYDIAAFKFTLRLAGQPWWSSAIARKNGSNTLSWAVALAARA